MVDLDHIHVYAWDARPYPGLPRRHRRLGRRRQLAPRPLAHRPHRQRAAGRHRRAPSSPTTASPPTTPAALDGTARRPRHRPRDVRARGAAAARARLLLRRARERRPHRLRPSRRRRAPPPSSTPDDLVENRARRRARHAHPRAGDRPARLRQDHLHRRRRRLSAGRRGSAPPRRPQRPRRRSPSCRSCSMPSRPPQIAEVWLFEAWAARERAAFALPPSRLALEPGDVVSPRRRRPHAPAAHHRDRRARRPRHRGPRPRSRGLRRRARRAPARPAAPSASSPASRFVVFLDLPLLRGDEPPARRLRRRRAEPLARRRRLLPLAGRLRLPAEGHGARRPPSPASRSIRCPPAPPRRFDRATSVRVQLDQGALASVTELALLGGANAAAIQNDDGEWEVLQFQSADAHRARHLQLSGSPARPGRHRARHARAPRRRRPLRSARRRAHAGRHDARTRSASPHLELRSRQPRHRLAALPRRRRTPSPARA